MKRILLAALLATSLASCKSESVDPDTSCATGSAQLFVGEGYLRLACGCVEGDNVTVWQGSVATCTVNVGTRVLFQFLEIRNSHQIVGDGSPNLGTLAVATSPIFAAFVPSLPAIGTYSFHDVFNSLVSGQIVVQ